MSKRIPAALLALALLACAPKVSETWWAEGTAPKSPDCKLDVYEPGLLPTDHSLPVIGEINIRDSGFTVNCGRTRIRQMLRERACAAGADAIEITQEKNPDLLSSCYRVKARLIRYADEGA